MQVGRRGRMLSYLNGKGLQGAISFSLGPIWLESDCLATVLALKEPSPNRSASCILIEEAKNLLCLAQVRRVSKCHRSENEVAHE